MNNGAPIMGNFVTTSADTSVYELSGIDKSNGPEAINEAVMLMTLERFKTQVPEPAQESILFAIHDTFMDKATAGLTGIAGQGEVLAPTDVNANNFSIQTMQIDGDMVFRVSPNVATMDRWPKWLTGLFGGTGNFTDVDALGIEMEFTLSEAGAMWNKRNLEPTVKDNTVNAIADGLRMAVDNLPMPEGATQADVENLLNPAGTFGGEFFPEN
jgi:hypothetical protein